MSSWEENKVGTKAFEDLESRVSNLERIFPLLDSQERELEWSSAEVQDSLDGTGLEVVPYRPRPEPVVELPVASNILGLTLSDLLVNALFYLMKLFKLVVKCFQMKEIVHQNPRESAKTFLNLLFIDLNESQDYFLYNLFGYDIVFSILLCISTLCTPLCFFSSRKDARKENDTSLMQENSRNFEFESMLFSFGAMVSGFAHLIILEDQNVARTLSIVDISVSITTVLVFQAAVADRVEDDEEILDLLDYNFGPVCCYAILHSLGSFVYVALVSVIVFFLFPPVFFYGILFMCPLLCLYFMIQRHRK